MSPTDRWVLAVDVGGSRVRSALLNGEGTLHARAEAATATGSLVEVLDAVVARTTASMKRGAVHACGISVPEYVHDGVVRSSAVVPWQAGEAVVRSRIDARLGGARRLVLEADVRCGAQAEHVLGGVERDGLLYVSWGTGLSCALVLPDGTVLEGAHGAALALGETGRAALDGQTLEEFASGAGLARRWTAQHRLQQARPQDLLQWAREGEAEAVGFLHQAGAAVGTALRDVVAVLDPTCVVLGGGLGATDGPHLDGLAEAYGSGASRLQDAPLRRPLAGRDSALLGAGFAAGRADGMAVGGPIRAAVR